MTVGSLFDGSGGFPLAAVINGVQPLWASEIEPYPIRVSKKRFPKMKHLGSVTEINGATVEPVDIITFGSPCQDLSVAGKQAGLQDGTRSNLFFEAIRIIKEMRHATNNLSPRIAIWENVPGAFSSNKGEDFRAVLQAFAQVSNPTADVPQPPKNKWGGAGAIMGNGWSLAWRTLDAQFWGVPQRRRRIYLIADFGSERAGEILFEQESLRGNSSESRSARKGSSNDAERGAGGSVDLVTESAGAFESYTQDATKAGTLKQTDYKGAQNVCMENGNAGGGANNQAICFQASGDRDNPSVSVSDTAYCLPANPMSDRGQSVCYAAAFKYGNSAEARSIGYQEEISPTLQAGEGGNQKPVVCYPVENHPNDSRVSIREDGIVPTLSSRKGTGGNNGPMVMTFQNTGRGWWNEGKTAQTLRTPCGGDSTKANLVLKVEPAKPPRKYIIRRLTPLECCRLQGFPDWWEVGVQGSDSARYKMWGNGIALPNAIHVIGCAAKLIKSTQQEAKNNG